MKCSSLLFSGRRGCLRAKRRRGSVALEFILLFPVIVIAFLAVIEFSILAFLDQAATTALLEATRVGAAQFPPSLPLDSAGADNDIADEIVKTINAHLATHRVEIVDPANGFTDDSTRANGFIRIERGASSVDRGALPAGFSCTRTGAAPDTDEIVVTLCFPLVDPNTSSPNGLPVPNILSSFGLTLESFTFEMTSRETLD